MALARFFRRSKGVTLPEIMLVITLIGILSVMGNQLFIQITRFFRLNQAKIDIQRDARAAFSLIGRNVREAQSLTVVIDNAAGQPPYSRLTLTKQNNDVMSFYQQGTNLMMTSPAETGTNVVTNTLSSHLLYLAFSHPHTDDNSIISVSLTMQEATYEGGAKALQLSVEQIRIMN